MGEIWPKKKSAGRRSIIEGSVLSSATIALSGSAQPLKAPSESRCAANVANTAAWSGCLVVSGERLMTRAFRATAKSAAAVPSGSPHPQAVHV